MSAMRTKYENQANVLQSDSLGVNVFSPHRESIFRRMERTSAQRKFDRKSTAQANPFGGRPGQDLEDY